MKKKLFNIFFVVSILLVVLTGFFSYRAIESANADTVSYHTVNFYGADNETVIYNVNCPAGYSLQDLQDSNFSLNSWFQNTTGNNTFNISSSGHIPIVSNWEGGWGKAVISSDDYALNISVTSSFVNVYQYLYTNNITAGHYVLVFKGNYNTISNFNQSWCLFTSTTTNQVVYVPTFDSSFYDYNDFFIVKYLDFNDNIMSQLGQSVQIGIQFKTGSNIGLDWCYFAKAENFVSYFDLDYVNCLFVNSGGIVDSDFEWSESSTSSSKFSFDMPITKDVNLYGYTFTGIEYNYNGDINSDFFNVGNYAIDSIEFLEVSGVPVLHAVFDCSKLSSDTILFHFSGLPNVYSDISTSSLYFYDVNHFGGFFLSSRNLSNSFYFSFSSGSPKQLDIIIKSGSSFGLVDLFWSMSAIHGINQNTFDIPVVDNFRFYNNLDSIVDMSSETNFEFIFDTSSSFNQSFMAAYHFLFDYQNYYSGTGFSNGIHYYKNSSFNDLSFSCTNFSFRFSNFVDVYDNNNLLSYYVDELFFFVHRPVNRVDNTLVIYNFDYYNLLTSCNSFSYQLQKNGNLYNVNYSGDIPNSYFIYLNSDEVLNTLFDEYVRVDMSFISNVIPVSFYGTSSFSCYLGFDFNFCYYTQPLVASSGTYNYTFEKPGYVDGSIDFSIVPPRLNIPFLAWVENIFIFLLFYCPIISQVLSLLKLDMFFGSLLQVVNFYINSGIGDFILSCLAFILFFAFLKLFMPVLISSGSSSVSYIVGSSNKKIVDIVQNNELGSIQRRLNLLENKRLLARQRVLASRIKPHHFGSYNVLHHYKRKGSNLSHIGTLNMGFSGSKNSSYRKSLVNMRKIFLKRKK